MVDLQGKNKINLIVNNKNELDNIFKIKIHGLILSGGNDLFNIRNKINLLREKNEIEIVKYFIKKSYQLLVFVKVFNYLQRCLVLMLQKSRIIKIKFMM